MVDSTASQLSITGRGCCRINLSVLQEAEKGRPHLPAPEALLGIPLSAGLPMTFSEKAANSCGCFVPIITG
jgi:hypothetical protein